MFNKVLIANRGEIALRVMRTCREMGIGTVAVFSEADRTAPHVLMADEAYPIGASPARDSYLRIDRILDAAAKSNVCAIHPGYGFLAENSEFAEAVQRAGRVFIGPPPAAIRSMGSKTEARRLMMDADVPVVPGDRTGLRDHKAAMESAEKIGYPVLLKAAKGGGGKGMRVIRSPEELPAGFDGARREALSAFGDDEVYLERFIEGPRHVEVQIIADHHGNCIHLNERECSIQRRHQKVIEEAPAPPLMKRPDLRKRMGETAVLAAKACGYVNAGTVEFLFDPDTDDFFFLEMNTRLQVEHPVTELITGIDLVRQQLLIAMGEKLQIRQDDVRLNGHAIECRIYAENTDGGFLPDAGKIENLVEPAGPWVRVDSGVDVGSEVGVYYDPLIAKLVVWGADRQAAIRRMHRALGEYVITGLKTNISFNRWVMENECYQSGNFDTRFIDQEFSPESIRVDDERLLAAAIAAAISERDQTSIPVPGLLSDLPANGNWKQAGRRRALR